MQKQEKKTTSNLKIAPVFSKKLKRKFNKRNKFKGKVPTKEVIIRRSFFKILRLLPRKFYGLQPSSLQGIRVVEPNYHRWRYIALKLKKNNIFLSLKCLRKNRILFRASTGKYKIKVSKKNIRFFIKPILIKFFKDIKLKINKNPIVVTVVSPLRLRKRILRLLQQKLPKNKKTIIKFLDKKCYNGCRASKKIRKKRRRLRFFKLC
jgi:hypothetical protein